MTLKLIDAWYAGIVEGARRSAEAWRAMKIWRALWNVMTALNLATVPDPSKGVRRKTPHTAPRDLAGSVKRRLGQAMRAGCGYQGTCA